MIRVLLALALSLAGPVAGAAVAHARSPLVGQLNVVATRSDEEKLAAYERGRASGRRAIEPEPKNFLGHLWYAINTARWGQTEGVVRPLFLLPTVREEIWVLLELAPDVAAVHALRVGLAKVLIKKNQTGEARRLLESIRDR